MTQNEADGRLFETTVPGSEWLEFQASGFDRPVSGIVHRTDRPPSCGMPLGGISTGCLDIEAWGVIGFFQVPGAVA